MTWHAYINDSGHYKELRLVNSFRGGYVLADLSNLEFVQHKEGEACLPSMHLHEPEQMQMLEALAQSLWDYGWRPSNLHASDEAQKRHLNDMRALAFAGHGVKDPESK